MPGAGGTKGLSCSGGSGGNGGEGPAGESGAPGGRGGWAAGPLEQEDFFLQKSRV